MPFVFATIDDNQRTLPFVLATIGFDWPQENIRRPDGYPWYQWIQCISGQGELIVNGQRSEVNPGDGFFLMPDEEHEYRSLSGNWITDWIGFGGFAVGEVLRFIGMERSGVYAISDFWQLKTILREVYDASLMDTVMFNHETSMLVYELLLSLKTALEPKTRNAQPRHAKLRPVLQFIHNHFDQDLGIEDLARVIDVTPQYLCKIFKQSLRQRPFEYLSSFRVSKAKELLVTNPKLSVSEIARVTGFTDSSYLCKVFKRVEGMSPGVFRSLHCPVSEQSI
jgi:AraC-like DNA-binding protein